MAIKMTVGDQEKPVVVDYFGRMAIPLDDAADWLTSDSFPVPGSLVPPSDDDAESCLADPSSASTTPSPSPTSSGPYTTSTTPATSFSTSASDTPSSTLNCQQNIATDGPSASRVGKALQDDDSFSSFCDNQASASSLYQSIKHGMLEISATRVPPGIA